MICSLCLCAERDEHLIDIVSGESIQQSVASIVYTHFRFCFSEEPAEGFVCQKCWIKVSVFHEFYIHVENVHRSKENIFVESIIDAIKTDVDSESDEWGLDTAPESAFINECPATPPKRKPGRPKKTDDYDDHCQDDKHSIDAVENVATVKVEVESEVIATAAPVTEVKKKKNRRRKGGSAVVKVEDTFICDRCALNFTTQRKLQRHTKLEHDALEFRCSYIKCIESFATEVERDIHYGTMHKQRQCPHCNKMILEKCIEQHIKDQHSEDSKFICDICGRVFATRRKHQSHYRKMHEVHIQLQCDICKRWLKHKDALKGHMLRHVQGPQTCSICGHVSPNRKALGKHKQSHDLQRKERFKCTTCGKGCRDKMSLLEHSHIHTGFAGRYTCNDCGRTFRFSSSFCLHKKKMHPK